jgi:hypothetical protein
MNLLRGLPGWAKGSGIFFIVAALGLQTNAQIITLADHNSVAQVDVGSQAGMFYWAVQGQNQLAQQWFWYRVGSDPVRSIDTISAPAITRFNGTRGLSTTYGNPMFSVQVDYLLSGGSVLAPGGIGVSDIGETITIVNRTAAPLEYHFYQYSDFDLGDPGFDTVQLGKNLRGFFNEASQVDINGAGLTETVTTPGAARGEVAFFNATLIALNSGTPYNLNNNSGPVGPGDVTWALQWDFNIPAYGSALISKDKYLSVLLIPEPSALALGLTGLAVLALRRRRA